MYRIFDIETWNRKETFEFFKDYTDPYAELSVEVDVSTLYDYCKQNGLSFAYATLWIALKLCNEIDNFRLRMVDDELRLYDVVHAAQTLGYEDGTYTHCLFQYYSTMEEFCIQSKLHATERKMLPKGHEPRTEDLDMIHTSILPWITFMSAKNPRRNSKDSTPKISIGRIRITESGKKMMPLGLGVHHSLMDGYQMGLFFNGYQEIANGISID